MPSFISEDDVEKLALEILSSLNYSILHGPDIAPDGIHPERNSYSDVALVERLKNAIYEFNPDIPQEAKDEAFKKILRTESPKLIVNNLAFHKMLVNGIDVEYQEEERIRGDKAWLFDFENPNHIPSFV